MPLYRAELLAKKPLRYAALIHDVSQVLYLPFDYDDGSYARDRSGRAHHSTIYGATLATGKIGMARTFDGTDDRIKVPHTTQLNITGDITISAWIYPTDLIGFRTIVGKRYDDFSTPYVFRAFGRKLEFYWGTAAGWEVHSTGDILTVKEWQFVAAVRKGSKWEIFRNLVSAASGTILASPTTSTVPVGVGSYRGDQAAELFYGRIDEPRIFNRGLSLSELCMLMYRRLV